MIFLAVDTAGVDAGLMLAQVINKRVIRKAFSAFLAKSTTECFIPELASLLKGWALTSRDVQYVVWNHGPGSFTGLRLASALLQGAFFDTTVTVLPVNGFSVAINALEPWNDNALHNDAKEAWKNRPRRALCASDARADEVYWQCYEYNGDQFSNGEANPTPEAYWLALGEIQVSPPSEVLAHAKSFPCDAGLGDGFERYPTLVHAIQTTRAMSFYPYPDREKRLNTMINMGINTLMQGKNSARINPEQRLAAFEPAYVRQVVAQKLTEQKTWQSRFLSGFQALPVSR